jgi:polyisoprenoid-binding protein YceI
MFSREENHMTNAAPTRTLDGVVLPEAGTYNIDASHSQVGFLVRHLVVAKVRGTFDSYSGSITIGDDPADSSVEVTIDTGSINTRDEQRDAHLRNPDFFDSDAFPTMTYKSTSVKHQKGNRWLVDGELTIKDVTRSVPLEVELEGNTADPWGNSRSVFSASAQIDRDAFGLSWNQALETGGFLVGKDVKIEIELETVRQA